MTFNDCDIRKHGGILDVIEEGDIVNGVKVVKPQGKNNIINAYVLSESGLTKNGAKITENEIHMVLSREKYEQESWKFSEKGDNNG